MVMAKMTPGTLLNLTLYLDVLFLFIIGGEKWFGNPNHITIIGMEQITIMNLYRMEHTFTLFYAVEMNTVVLLF